MTLPNINQDQTNTVGPCRNTLVKTPSEPFLHPHEGAVLSLISPQTETGTKALLRPLEVRVVLGRVEVRVVLGRVEVRVVLVRAEVIG